MIRRLLWRIGFNIYRISSEERAEFEGFERCLSGQTLTTVFGDDAGLLRNLKSRYARVNLPIAVHSVWERKGTSDTEPDIGLGGVDLRAFRGHSAYVWSHTGSDPRLARMKYFIYADAVRRKDSIGLLGKLREDAAFGCIGFDFPGIGFVSRDLMDSIFEINFLHKHLNVIERDDLRVLDIGAGYGRMAHRMLEANPQIGSYTCVDAVPESTFLCEFYLKHRGLQNRVQVVPLDEVEHKLLPGQYDLALNIHSFSECTYAAVEWWLMRIKTMNVQHLMIISNNPSQFLSSERDGKRRDYAPLLQTLGYEVVAWEQLFDDPAVRELIGVHDNIFLFEQKTAE